MLLRWNLKRICFCMLITVQVLLVVAYLLIQKNSNIAPNVMNPLSFQKVNEVNEKSPTYHTFGQKVHLKTSSTKEYFMDFNSSLCFTGGTDLRAMISKQVNWMCICLPSWHGSDCGQPEVLFRAMLTHKSSFTMKRPRTTQRRIIYIFQTDAFNEYLTEMRIYELSDVIDLFVIYEPHGNYISHKLNNEFCKEHHKKILYVPHDIDIKTLWKLLSKHIHNLKQDDILLTSNTFEIPNKDALIFLRYYENIPEPLGFRLKWSVYGFFWLHPKETIISGGACTISNFKKMFNSNLTLLGTNVTGYTHNNGIVLGDLNHTGGWFCELCNTAFQIVEYLASNSNIGDYRKIIKLPALTTQFVESIIQNGLYIDGKMELLRTHKSSDKYFAPSYVIEHDWKFDVLLINMFSQMDYYD